MIFQRVFTLGALTLIFCGPFFGQSADTPTTTPASSTATVIPNIIRFAGSLPDRADQKLTLTFSLYEKPEAGDALWTETHEMTLSHTGAYSVLLGSKAALPILAFTTGQARWIGAALKGEPEQARILLAATAYAVKAGDAETLGGLPASAFLKSVVAPGSTAPKAGITPNAITGVVAGYGLKGGGNSGNVTLALNTTTTNSLYAQLHAANTFTMPQTLTTTALTGVTINDSGSGSTAAYANAGGTNSKAVYADAGGTAITGQSRDTGTSIQNVGVWGKLGSISSIGSGFGTASLRAGVWGDGGEGFNPTHTNYAVLGTTKWGSAGYFHSGYGPGIAAYSDNGIAGIFTTNGGSYGLYVSNSGTTDLFYAVDDRNGANNYCYINSSAYLFCSGGTAVIGQVAGRQIASYGTQSTEQRTEDTGTAKLVEGTAHVPIDPTFAGLANTIVDYQVFLTPGGESKGLYVTHKTASGFDVKEMGGGRATISFDYRITAKQRGHEKERLADMTTTIRAQRLQNAQLRQPRSLRAGKGIH